MELKIDVCIIFKYIKKYINKKTEITRLFRFYMFEHLFSVFYFPTTNLDKDS